MKMNRTNTAGRLLALLLLALMMLSLTACGTKNDFCILPSSGGVVVSLPAGTLIAPCVDSCAASGYFSSIMVSLVSMSRIFSASP